MLIPLGLLFWHGSSKLEYPTTAFGLPFNHYSLATFQVRMGIGDVPDELELRWQRSYDDDPPSNNP
jgi:hypothetical protein